MARVYTGRTAVLPSSSAMEYTLHGEPVMIYIAQAHVTFDKAMVQKSVVGVLTAMAGSIQHKADARGLFRTVVDPCYITIDDKKAGEVAAVFADKSSIVVQFTGVDRCIPYNGVTAIRLRINDKNEREDTDLMTYAMRTAIPHVVTGNDIIHGSVVFLNLESTAGIKVTLGGWILKGEGSFETKPLHINPVPFMHPVVKTMRMEDASDKKTLWRRIGCFL